MQSIHQVAMKNVVKWVQDFFHYFKALETNSVYRARLWGSQHLCYLNFYTCMSNHEISLRHSLQLWQSWWPTRWWIRQIQDFIGRHINGNRFVARLGTLVAHRFGRVEFQIFVLSCFLWAVNFRMNLFFHFSQNMNKKLSGFLPCTLHILGEQWLHKFILKFTDL